MSAQYFRLERADPPKKWQVRVPSESGRGRLVKFGEAGASDFTIHKDTARRARYRDRHQNDRVDDPYAPGFWSWHVLWGETTDIKRAFKSAVKRAEARLPTEALFARQNPATGPRPIPDGFLEGSIITEPVWHGTRRRGLTELRPDLGGEYGIFLTPKRRYARMYAEPRGSVYEVFVNIANPLQVEGKYEISPRDLTEADVRQLERDGFDSIVVASREGVVSEIVAFYPEQVHVFSEVPL